jgi:endonuclease/exonuclease/phosphatase family metal-dependent hydrolase
MRTLHKLLAALGLLALAACQDSPVSPATQDPSLMVGGPEHRLIVMSRNMYVGAEMDAVVAALTNNDPSDDFGATINAYRTLRETDYYTRVQAVAAEIARYHPAIVGLQEVSQIDMEFANSEDTHMAIHGDFMVELNEELAELELPYVVAAKVPNWAVEPFAGVKMAGYDVFLVDPAQVTVGATITRTFQHNLGGVAPGVQLLRGWTGVEASYAGQHYAFVTTQLESGAEYADLRTEQVSELLHAMANRARVVILGDFNDQPGSAMYRKVLDKGFRDAWADIQPEPGYTCCLLPDLSNEGTRGLDRRTDFVFAKGLALPETGKLAGDITLTGVERRERIPGPAHPIWPSDHAGVVARLRLPFQPQESN